MKKRKPIQISTIPDGNTSGRLYVLCNDGTIWLNQWEPEEEEERGAWRWIRIDTSFPENEYD